MVVWGGSDGGRMSSGGRYDPAGNSWVPTANSQSPLARHDHTALWTGAEMVVWGGYNSGPLGIGAALVTLSPVAAAGGLTLAMLVPAILCAVTAAGVAMGYRSPSATGSL